MINIEVIEKLEQNLKMRLDVELNNDHMVIKCDNKCRLLSHLIHRTGLDIHCSNKGIFIINYEDHSLTEILNCFQMIIDNPVWVIEFIEKYFDNEFMMSSTFKPVEQVSAED